MLPGRSGASAPETVKTNWILNMKRRFRLASTWVLLAFLWQTNLAHARWDVGYLSNPVYFDSPQQACEYIGIEREGIVKPYRLIWMLPPGYSGGFFIPGFEVSGPPLPNPENSYAPYTPDAGIFCIFAETYAAPISYLVDQRTNSLILNGLSEVRPSGTSGSNTVTINAKVTAGALPKSGVPVSFAVEVTPGSGGHDHHDTTRPKGKLSASQGTTDANGEVIVTFTGPEISGVHTIKATCETCTNSPASREVKVKIPELLNVFALPFRYPKWAYPGIGQIPGRHTDNHYLTIAAATRLLGLAQKFNKIWPDAPRLTLNDASLEWGGKFDIPATWERNPLAHAEHRLGDNIDVRANSAPGAVPAGIRDTVFRWLRKTSRRQDNIPPEFVIESVNPLREGIGTQNEHFHLRLGN